MCLQVLYPWSCCGLPHGSYGTVAGVIMYFGVIMLHTDAVRSSG